MRCPFASRRFLRTGSPNKSNSTVSTVITGISRLITDGSKVCIGAIVEAIPTTSSVLKRFDPMMLPNARSFSPLRAAAIELASSGRDVPTATMVRPISKSLTPRARAISTAPHTSARELPTSSASPSTSHRTDFPSESDSPSCFSASSATAAFAAAFWRISFTMLNPMTPAKTSRRITPSRRLIEPSETRNTDIAVTAINTGRSRFKAFRTTITGEMTAVTPRISAIFAMLLP